MTTSTLSPAPRWKAWNDANITCEGVPGHVAECSTAERARQIVNALNAHDAMLEALQAAQTFIEGFEDIADDADTKSVVDKLLRDSRAAIAKAQGGAA